MAKWIEILDHGSDPGRYTYVDGSGRVITANENGSVVCVRQSRNPEKIVTDFCREPLIKIVRPSVQKELIKKINQHLNAHLSDDNDSISNRERPE